MEKSLQSLDSGEGDLPNWGPSEQELAEARHTSLVACVVEGEAEYSGDIDDIDDDLGFEEEEDAGLADALDAVDLADNSRGEGVDEDDVFSDEDYCVVRFTLSNP